MIECIRLGSSFPRPRAFLRDLAKIEKQLRVPAGAQCELYCVDARRMRALNIRFRRKNRATTVLSFPVCTRFPAGAGQLMGEIYVNPDSIAAQPVPVRVHRGRVGFYGKFVYYIVHGVLHLRGFDHETAWFSRKRMEGVELRAWYTCFPNV